mgnify:CR=1 FL=1
MGVLARIILRVIAGIMMGRGVDGNLVDVLNDPAVAIGLEAVLGGIVWFVVEVFYVLAKRFGWRT